MNVTKILLPCAVICCIVPAPAQDLVVRYAAESDISLGRGIDQLLLAPKGQAIAAEKSWRQEGAGAARVELAVADNSIDAMKVLEVDVSAHITGAYKGFKGAAQYTRGIVEHFRQFERAIHVVLIADRDWRGYGIDNARLKEEAAELYMRSPDEFWEKYGTHYVSQENRVSRLYSIYSFDLSRSSQRSLDALKSSVDFDYNKLVSMDSGFEQKFELLKKVASVEIRHKMDSIGVGAIPPMRHDVGKIGDTIESFNKILAGLKREDSVALSYTCQPYWNLPGVMQRVVAAQGHIVESLATEYFRLEVLDRRVSGELDKLSGGRNGRLETYLQSERAKIRVAKHSLEQAIYSAQLGQAVAQEPVTYASSIGSIWDPVEDFQVSLVGQPRLNCRIDGAFRDIGLDVYELELYRVSRDGKSQLVKRLPHNSPELQISDDGLRFAFFGEQLAESEIIEDIRYDLRVKVQSGVESTYDARLPVDR